MLAGIKTGKKKKKAEPKDVPTGSLTNEPGSGQQQVVKRREMPVEKSAEKNQSVAEQLRQSLAAGISPPVVAKRPALNDLERRGRIQKATAFDSNHTGKIGENVIVLMDNRNPKVGSSKDASEMSIQEMVVEESIGRAWAEEETRNAYRLGKKRRLKERSIGDVDSDEEEYRQMQNIPEISSKKPRPKDIQKAEQRENSRQLAQHDLQSRITSKCWWWIEAGDSFQRHRLAALGDSVSLVMAPTQLSLTPGEHFYLVPIPHVESLAGCDENVWKEILLFQNSLRTLYGKEKKSVLFCETVLPTSGFWQTKLECIVVPSAIGADAPLFFKSALTEQAEEWGTHQKLMQTGNGNDKKDLRRTVPANFSYFYLEYGDKGNGYAQMIESNNFPKTFGVDTVAGMLEMDPIRFRRKEKTSYSEEKLLMQNFLEKWKDVDWTVQLDS